MTTFNEKFQVSLPIKYTKLTYKDIYLIMFGCISRPARSIQHYSTQYEYLENRPPLYTAKVLFVIPCDQSELQPRTAVLSVNFTYVFRQPSLYCSIGLN